jgi:hypothetical protein
LKNGLLEDISELWGAHNNSGIAIRLRRPMFISEAGQVDPRLREEDSGGI